MARNKDNKLYPKIARISSQNGSKNANFGVFTCIGLSANLAEYSAEHYRPFLAEYSAEYSVFGRTLIPIKKF